MAKLAILVAALLFLAVTVSAYKTTVTTVEIDEDENPSWSHGQGRCAQKLQRVNLRPCERYVKEKCRREEPDVIALRGIQARGNERLQECCDQIREINDRSCQCQALKRVMRREGSELEGREARQLRQELQRLPERCNIELPRCELSGNEI
ncbi:2S albumin-like [Neltuma alba]|uniref:2S albumin-like n=1 Tax=Neltuma alba TaxID=207710 RepID=UPI0010A492C9|nr:2S albumin-like [Prosopis alba]